MYVGAPGNWKLCYVTDFCVNVHTKKKRVNLFPWTWSSKIVFCVYFTKLLWECAFNNSFRFHASSWLLKNVWRRNSCSVHFNSMVWSRSLISAVTRLQYWGFAVEPVYQICLSVWESVCIPLQASRNSVIVLNDLLDGYISVCDVWNVPVSEWFMPCFSQIMSEHAFVHTDQIKAVQSLANWTTWQPECIW